MGQWLKVRLLTSHLGCHLIPAKSFYARANTLQRRILYWQGRGNDKMDVLDGNGKCSAREETAPVGCTLRSIEKVLCQFAATGKGKFTQFWPTLIHFYCSLSLEMMICASKTKNSAFCSTRTWRPMWTSNSRYRRQKCSILTLRSLTDLISTII